MALNFQEYNQKGLQFLKEVADEMKMPEDLEYTDRFVTSTLEVLREMITPEESLHLISQLPMYLKGLYVNGWKISKSPKSINTREEFFTELRDKYPKTTGRDLGDYRTARENVKALFKVIRKYSSGGEIDHLKAQLPETIAQLLEEESNVSENK